MVYSCPMHMTHLAGSHQPSAWTKALHFFYAGLYAFVLPFICWGAQATPGHPHARPHFVFVDPPGHTHLAEQTKRGVQNAAAWLAAYANSTICGDHDGAPVAAAPDAETAQQPVGRSAPSQLVISMLTPLGQLAALLPLQIDGPGCAVWLVAACASPFCTPIPTPPPR